MATKKKTICECSSECSHECSCEEKTTLKDSGERTSYDTGAVRDMKQGKGRFDLVPIWVIGYSSTDDILIKIGKFVDEMDVRYLFEALDLFYKSEAIDTYGIFLDLSRHFEAGAEKYEARNWEKGIPISSYIDSAVRHYCKYRSYMKDEPHDIAFVWNIVCLIETLRRVSKGVLPSSLLDLPGFDNDLVLSSLYTQLNSMRCGR